MSELLDCPAAETWSVLLDEGLSHDEQDLFERHLETCAACQQHLDRAGWPEDGLLCVGRRVGDPTRQPADPKLKEFLQTLQANWLSELINRLMAKDPAERLQSADETATLLEGYLAHLGKPAAVRAPHLVRCPADCDVCRTPSKLFKSFARPFRLLAWIGVLFAITLLLCWFARARAFVANADQPPDADVDEGIWTLTFSPDGARLVTAGGKQYKPGQIRIWDVATHKLLVARRAPLPPRSIAFSPDGQILAAGRWNGDIELRDPVSGEVRTRFHAHDSGVNSLAFSDDSAMLVSGGLDQAVRLWDVKAQKELHEWLGHTGMVFSVAFFHDGQAVVSAGEDRTVRVWDVSAGKERFVLQASDKVESVLVLPGDKMILAGSWDGAIRLWDPATGAPSGVLQQFGGGVMSLAFSPDGKTLASGGSNGAIYLWDLPSRKLRRTVRPHQAGVRGLAFSPDGQVLASGSEDRTTLLWDPSLTRQLANLTVNATEPAPVVWENEELASGTTMWLPAAIIILGFLLASIVALWLCVRRKAGSSVGHAR